VHPYKNLPLKAFWKTAVADKNMFSINELWSPKFEIASNDRVSTFGSCFAQHIGKALKARGYNWFDAENAPYGMSDKNKKRYNYNVLDKQDVPSEFWTKNERFIDPFRPMIEPDGFETENEMLASRKKSIDSFRVIIRKSNVFVFTLGLTESWFNRPFGYEYPMCPGTIGGEFSDETHEFQNQKFSFIKDNLIKSIALMRKYNKDLKFILTVSPVPLTATNSGEHVLVATQLSKSTLRTVAGEVANEFDFVDYFPSYEIISSPPFKGVFYESNQRSVVQNGVNHVMDNFFNSLTSKPSNKLSKSKVLNINQKQDEMDVVCEEELLSAFMGTTK
jgi:hypothetical protein